MYSSTAIEEVDADDTKDVLDVEEVEGVEVVIEEVSINEVDVDVSLRPKFLISYFPST